MRQSSNSNIPSPMLYQYVEQVLSKCKGKFIYLPINSGELPSQNVVIFKSNIDAISEAKEQKLFEQWVQKYVSGDIVFTKATPTVEYEKLHFISLNGISLTIAIDHELTFIITHFAPIQLI